MAEKKSPPRNILSDILSDTPGGINRNIEELNKLIHCTPALGPAKKAKKSEGAAPVRKAKKRKMTHYLTEEVFDHLGTVKSVMKDFLPSDLKSKATKSRIVDYAVKMVLEEFGEKGENSPLIEKILHSENDK